MGSCYDLICSRCHQTISNINEVHKNGIKTCAPKRKASGAFVYLFLDEHQNLLKIGFTENPARRFKEIRNANTNPVKFIGYMPGTKTNEAILHHKWKRFNKKLEWFNYDDEIVEYFMAHPEFKPWELS
jgi:predicted GIY-YIG superfamily endonuclease